MNDLPKKIKHIHSRFRINLKSLISEFEMLKEGTTLYNPRNYFIFNREALLTGIFDDKLLKAFFSEVKTCNVVKKLIGYE